MEDMLKCEKKLWNWIFKLKLFDYYRCYGFFFLKWVCIVNRFKDEIFVRFIYVVINCVLMFYLVFNFVLFELSCFVFECFCNIICGLCDVVCKFCI